MAELVPIEGVIRDYDWGSPTVIPELLGLQPDGRPAAELWFGAHPGDPSPTPDGPLDTLIAADATGRLGAAVVERFGPHLPFLLKLLAADRALSIQVHPNRTQARAGFAAEEAAGIPRTAPERNYVDDNHKPELLCALSPFEALCGFRPVHETLALLDEIALPQLGFVAELLRRPGGLRAAFTALLTHDDPSTLAAAVGARAQPAGPLRPAYLAAHDFPGDIGVVLTLLLNHVRLEPGEAIYLGAGNVHSYLRGTGVEIMASSDNVLRCGLTAKYVDIDELLEITDFGELADPRCPAETDGCTTTFRTPVDDFELRFVDLDTVAGSCAVDPGGPHIVLCVEPGAELSAGDSTLALTPGHAAFVPASSAAVRLHGAGRVFVATTPR